MEKVDQNTPKSSTFFQLFPSFLRRGIAWGKGAKQVKFQAFSPSSRVGKGTGERVGERSKSWYKSVHFPRLLRLGKGSGKGSGKEANPGTNQSIFSVISRWGKGWGKGANPGINQRIFSIFSRWGKSKISDSWLGKTIEIYRDFSSSVSQLAWIWSKSKQRIPNSNFSITTIDIKILKALSKSGCNPL